MASLNSQKLKGHAASIRGFIKGRAPGKLTGCGRDFARVHSRSQQSVVFFSNRKIFLKDSVLFFLICLLGKVTLCDAYQNSCIFILQTLNLGYDLQKVHCRSCVMNRSSICFLNVN